VLVSSPERNNELLEYRRQVNFGLPTPQAKSKLESLLAKITPNPKVVLAGVVQSKLALIVMHLRLRSLPRLWRFSSKLTAHAIDEVARQKFEVSKNSAVRFEKFLRELLATNLPTIYLEGFKELQAKVGESQIKQHPKLIFTNTLLHRNEQFKVWSAEHVVFGATKLVSGQHGGGYGLRMFDGWPALYEMSVVDRFMSWGWSDNLKKVVVPTCVQSHQDEFFSDRRGGLLVVMGPVTRNSDNYGMIGIQSNSGYLDYLKELINLLPEDILKKTEVRPKNASAIGKPARVSSLQVSELLDNLIKIDTGVLTLGEKQSQNRLSIVTYNETTIPTNLLVGYPTVAMWDPKYVRLVSSAKNIYGSLLTAKILHHSPESAAQHLVEVWDDVDAWWTSKVVLQARETFCENFARHSKFPALTVAKALADYR
ncbi:MAG: hypothetical protein RJA79_700, partial [Actinomycetota bacterium]